MADHSGRAKPDLERQPMDAPTLPPSFAGFWRRAGAFLLDNLLLAGFGLLLGLLLHGALVRLDPWGTLVGFAIAWVYFGVLNSRLGGGQTMGKRLLKIRVVSAEGKALPLPRALLRFLPLGLGYLALDVLLPATVYHSPWGTVLTSLLTGLVLSSAYLLVFNRPSRRTLHDWCVGSQVVPVQGVGLAAPAKPLHQAIVCALLLLMCFVPWLASSLTGAASRASQVNIHKAVSAAPSVAQVRVGMRQSFAVGSQGFTVHSDGWGAPWLKHVFEAVGWPLAQDKSTRQLTIRARLLDPEAIYRRENALSLAALALAANDGALAVDVVQVTLAHGYDIGIMSVVRSSPTYTVRPNELAAN